MATHPTTTASAGRSSRRRASSRSGSAAKTIGIDAVGNDADLLLGDAFFPDEIGRVDGAQGEDGVIAAQRAAKPGGKARSTAPATGGVHRHHAPAHARRRSRHRGRDHRVLVIERVEGVRTGQPPAQRPHPVPGIASGGELRPQIHARRRAPHPARRGRATGSTARRGLGGRDAPTARRPWSPPRHAPGWRRGSGPASVSVSRPVRTGGAWSARTPRPGRSRWS